MIWLQERYFKVWKGMDPWTYQADDIQKKIRQEVLRSKVKASDRYLLLREKNLSTTLMKISKQYGEIPTSDNVIERLMIVEQAEGNFNTPGNVTDIDLTFVDKYKSLLASNLWKELKDKYLVHTAAFEKEFAEERVMDVFDLKNGLKELKMSPLDSIKYLNQHLQNALLAVDPKTGYIKAWVGGINHSTFKYDHVTSRRSVGSTLKPFVYTCAMAVGGISPCQEFEDIQYTIAQEMRVFMLTRNGLQQMQQKNLQAICIIFIMAYCTLKTQLR